MSHITCAMDRVATCTLALSLTRSCVVSSSSSRALRLVAMPNYNLRSALHLTSPTYDGDIVLQRQFAWQRPVTMKTQLACCSPGRHCCCSVSSCQRVQLTSWWKVSLSGTQDGVSEDMYLKKMATAQQLSNPHAATHCRVICISSGANLQIVHPWEMC